MNPAYGDWSNFQHDGCDHLRGVVPALQRVDREALVNKRGITREKVAGDEATRRGFKTDEVTREAMDSFVRNSPYIIKPGQPLAYPCEVEVYES